MVSVVQGSGPCAAEAASSGVTVSCGVPAVPTLAPVAGGVPSDLALTNGVFGLPAAPFVDPSLSRPASDGSFPTALDPDGRDRLREEESRFRQVGVLPVALTGQEPVPVYAGRVHVTGWRVVTVDAARHVEVTISW